MAVPTLSDYIVQDVDRRQRVQAIDADAPKITARFRNPLGKATGRYPATRLRRPAEPIAWTISSMPVVSDRGRLTDKPVVIIGGEDHKTGQDEDIENRFARLTAWGRKHFPGVKEPEFRWSGQVVESVDGLAFIGRNPGDEPNVYIATGDSGAGLTHGTIAGVLLRGLILGRDNPWTTLYDPARKSLLAAHLRERKSKCCWALCRMDDAR